MLQYSRFDSLSLQACRGWQALTLSWMGSGLDRRHFIAKEGMTNDQHFVFLDVQEYVVRDGPLFDFWKVILQSSASLSMNNDYRSLMSSTYIANSGKSLA